MCMGKIGMGSSKCRVLLLTERERERSVSILIGADVTRQDLCPTLDMAQAKEQKSDFIKKILPYRLHVTGGRLELG